MRSELEGILKKINACKIGEDTEWRDGYVAGLYDAVETIEKGICNLIAQGNNYFVIMYYNGDKYFPYVEEMRLYKIDRRNKHNKYYFSRNLNATLLYPKPPDLMLSGEKAIRDRIFFTREFAEKSINDKV